MPTRKQSEKRAARIAGVFVHSLRVCVVGVRTESAGYSEPTDHVVGIAVLWSAAHRNMPWLAEGQAEAISNHGKRALERCPLSQPVRNIALDRLWWLGHAIGN